MGWIGLVVGAVIGVAGAIGGWATNAAASKAEHDALEAQRTRNLQLMDLEYETTRKEANKEADKSDEATTLAEVMLGANASNALGQLGLGQEASALEYNQAAINAGVGEGGAYNSIAGSGTRGSSAMQAVEMQAEMQGKQLQAQEDMDRQNAELTLESAMNSLAQESFDLQSRRTAADDLRKAYAEGGSQYNIYQKKRSNYKADVQVHLDQLQKNQEWGWDETLNLFTAGAMGATNGYKIGTQIGEFKDDWGKPKLDKAPKVDTNTASFNNLGTGYNSFYLG